LSLQFPLTAACGFLAYRAWRSLLDNITVNEEINKGRYAYLWVKNK
jgi:hypothetical protein